VRVRDEGVGMSEDHALHCFDRFWQAEPTDVRRFGGTGIGLYIVRSLVEGMDGSVTVASAPGDGSTFTVSLWIAARRPEPTDEPDGSTPERGRGEPSIIREYMRQLGVKVEAGT
jgi:signal transduction histidine kinase